MKTAILLATRKDDPLAVKVLRHGLYSEILAEFKGRVATARGEAGYDCIEVWTGPPAKRHTKFQGGCGEVAAVELGKTAPTAEQFAEIAEAWQAVEKGYETRIAELEAELAELKRNSQGADPKGEGASEPQAPTDEGGIPGDQAADQTGGESSPGGDAAPSSTDLPHNEAGTGEGDLPGAQADQTRRTDQTGEAAPGSLSPKKGKK